MWTTKAAQLKGNYTFCIILKGEICSSPLKQTNVNIHSGGVNHSEFIQLLLFKSRYLHRIKRGIHYTNPQSETVQVTVFLDRHVILVYGIKTFIYLYLVYNRQHQMCSRLTIFSSCLYTFEGVRFSFPRSLPTGDRGSLLSFPRSLLTGD